VFVDEVSFEATPVREGSGAEEAVMTWLILAGVSMVMGPAGFGGDKQAVLAAKKDLVVGGHKRTMRDGGSVSGMERVEA
jgi:hypothetical protein